MAAVAYFDHAASTPMHPEVVESMRDFFDACYANPTGAHRMARDARRATDDARDILAEALGARPAEIVFCGSGTEADNLAIIRVCCGRRGRRRSCAPPCGAPRRCSRPIEAQHGGRVVGVDRDGVLIDLDALDRGAGPRRHGWSR